MTMTTRKTAKTAAKTKPARKGARWSKAPSGAMSASQLRYWWWQKREAERQKARHKEIAAGGYSNPGIARLDPGQGIGPSSARVGKEMVIGEQTMTEQDDAIYKDRANDQTNATGAASVFLPSLVYPMTAPPPQTGLPLRDDKQQAGVGGGARSFLNPVPTIAHETAPSQRQVRSAQLDLFARPVDRLQQQIAIAGNRGPSQNHGNLWPTIQRSACLPDPQTFDFAAYTAAFEGSTVNVYQACSPGLARLASEARLFVMKIGATVRDPSARLRELNLDQYASLMLGPDGYERGENWQNWEALRIFAQEAKHADSSPVECLPRCLRVSLPDGLPPEAFDMTLREALDPARLDRWIDTPNGDLYCRRHGVPKSALRRFTAHHRQDGDLVIRPATELYIFRREDAPLLIELIEAVIARHLLQTRPASHAVIHGVSDRVRQPRVQANYGSMRGSLRVRLNP